MLNKQEDYEKRIDIDNIMWSYLQVAITSFGMSVLHENGIGFLL